MYQFFKSGDYQTKMTTRRNNIEYFTNNKFSSIYKTDKLIKDVKCYFLLQLS